MKTYPPPLFFACEFTQKLMEQMDGRRSAKDAQNSTLVGFALPRNGKVPSTTPTAQGSSVTGASGSGILEQDGGSMFHLKETAGKGAAAWQKNPTLRHGKISDRSEITGRKSKVQGFAVWDKT